MASAIRASSKDGNLKSDSRAVCPRSRFFGIGSVFADVLNSVDHLILLPVMGGREADDGSVASEDLAAKIPGCVCVSGLEEAAQYVQSLAEPGDLIITIFIILGGPK